MAGENGGNSLEETPTWAVAVVCFILVAISIIVEQIIHLIGQWLKRKHKRALSESLEKIKAELMLLGFISLLLTVLQKPISNICISKSVANRWLPCNRSLEEDDSTGSSYSDAEEEHRRKLLGFTTTTGGSFRRMLASDGTDKCAEKNKVAFISYDGIHQLHIFIFVLALSHVLYCILTLALGRAKMKRWKAWEKETRTVEYQFSHDPSRFRFARETSFGRRHLNFWTKNSVLIWFVCFFRQFVRSVPKVDYLTLRHGFIFAHLAPQSHTHFDFQKYINRSLEEDFKEVVGISPPIWLFAVIFLLFNTHGWYSYLWLPFIPLIIILLVGTKLQVIITNMALRIVERAEVVRGVPVVELGDDLFWFNRPHLILYLIRFVLFQNAFQLAFLAWSSMEFGIKSCFHSQIEDLVIRITMGILIQILCSYVTLPLYALVTQMGSTMKPTIFKERVATALKNWHHRARKNIKLNRQSGSVTPFSSRPVTPFHDTSPVHLLRYYSTDINDSIQNSPRSMETDQCNTESPSPSNDYCQQGGDESLPHRHSVELSYYMEEFQEPGPSRAAPLPQTNLVKDFSFDRRVST